LTSAFFAAALFCALAPAGCSTDNDGPQPWNQQQAWESNLPADINRGR